MKPKKTMAMLLGAVMALSAFTACGKNPAPKPDDGDDPTPPPVTEMQPITDTVRLLTQTPYQSDEATGKYGLSDATKVGVNPAAAQTELYPKKADAEFGQGNIVELDSFTGTDDSKMTAALAQAKALNAGGAVKLKLPDRDITLSAPVTVSGFDGLWVEGGEKTQLLIDCAQAGGWVGAIRASNSKNLHFNSVDIDYAVLPAITGIVTSSDASALSVTMSIPESMHSTIAAYRSIHALGGSIKSLIEYNRYTDAPAEGGIVAIHSDGIIKNFTFNGNEEITVTFQESYAQKFEAPVKNTPFAIGFAMYDNAGVSFSSCENVYVEDCNLYACPGMACTVSSTTNFYANRFNFARKEDRYMTATADGFHAALCLGEVKITNSILENTHDDALNIKSGYWYSLSNYDATAREFTFARKTGTSPATEIGDTLELYASDTFTLLGSFTVKEVSGGDASITVKVNERISGNVDWSKAMMTNVTKSASLTFTNNIVRNKRNRGILVQVRGALIENNAFMNVGHGSMQIASSMDIYNETTVPRDITVRANKLVNNGYLLGEGLRGDISVFAIGSTAIVAPSDTVKNVTIENNFIANGGNAGISLRGVGSTTVENNLFYNVARVYASEMTECCIELENCAGILVKGNYNYNTNDSSTFSGIIPCGMTNTDDITLEGNTNLRYQETDGEVPNTEVKKLDAGTITIDGDLSDWEGVGNTVEMNGASETTGDEILYETYSNVFDVRTAKIAWTDDGVYIAFDIFDDTPDYKTIANSWEGDGVEIFLSTVLNMPNADFQLFRNEGDVLQLACVPNWTVPYNVITSRSSDAIFGGKDAIQVKTNVRSDGYSGEMFFPFSLFQNVKAAADNGDKVAIAFVFMDADRDNIGRKRIQVSNVPHFVEANKTKTAKMPTFTFVA